MTRLNVVLLLPTYGECDGREEESPTASLPPLRSTGWVLIRFMMARNNGNAVEVFKLLLASASQRTVSPLPNCGCLGDNFNSKLSCTHFTSVCNGMKGVKYLSRLGRDRDNISLHVPDSVNLQRFRYGGMSRKSTENTRRRTNFSGCATV